MIKLVSSYKEKKVPNNLIFITNNLPSCNQFSKRYFERNTFLFKNVRDLYELLDLSMKSSSSVNNNEKQTIIIKNGKNSYEISLKDLYNFLSFTKITNIFLSKPEYAGCQIDSSSGNNILDEYGKELLKNITDSNFISKKDQAKYEFYYYFSDQIHKKIKDSEGFSSILTGWDSTNKSISEQDLIETFTDLFIKNMKDISFFDIYQQSKVFARNIIHSKEKIEDFYKFVSNSDNKQTNVAFYFIWNMLTIISNACSQFEKKLGFKEEEFLSLVSSTTNKLKTNIGKINQYPHYSFSDPLFENTLFLVMDRLAQTEGSLEKIRKIIFYYHNYSEIPEFYLQNNISLTVETKFLKMFCEKFFVIKNNEGDQNEEHQKFEEYSDFLNNTSVKENNGFSSEVYKFLQGGKLPEKMDSLTQSQINTLSFLKKLKPSKKSPNIRKKDIISKTITVFCICGSICLLIPLMRKYIRVISV